MAQVTVLGMGPMGRALAGAFLRAGHATTVWNRTPGRAKALVAQGATEAASAAEAISASPLTVVSVVDYAAVRSIVEPSAADLKGRTLVNLTADTPGNARAMASWAAEHGIAYLDGAVMTPTPTIGGPQAVVLYSGPEGIYHQHRHTLEAIGGTAAHLGTDPGRAAAHDVALLDLFWTSMSGLVHAFALARAEGIDARALAPFAKGIGELLPSLVDSWAEQADKGDFPGGESTLTSAAAGIEHILDVARSHNLDTRALSAVHDLAERAIAQGHGDDGFARLTQTIRT